MQLTNVNVALGFTSGAHANDEVGALIASSRHRVNGPKTSTDIPAALAPEREQPRSGAKVIPLLTPTATSKPAPESVFGTLGDDELMHLAASGSSGALASEAFAALLLRHERRVRNYCAKWCGNAARSDEMAQEVFVDLWRHRSDYKASGRFDAYLFTLVRNRCRSDHRKVTVERKLESYEPTSNSPDQLERLIDYERLYRLNEAVARLPPKLRESLLMRYGAGLEYAEIARVVEAPESTVRSRVFLAICQLKEWAKEAAL